MQMVKICSISVTVCVPFLGYISTRSWETGYDFRRAKSHFTPRQRRVNGKGLIAQRIPHVFVDILRGRIGESAACGRDSLVEGLNRVKAEKDRLER